MTEMLIIGGVVVLLFGAKRIPDLFQSMGQGLRIFKKELSHTEEESKEKSEKTDAS
jgi:sec-independent protein translocase protein TatA